MTLLKKQNGEPKYLKLQERVYQLTGHWYGPIDPNWMEKRMANAPIGEPLPEIIPDWKVYETALEGINDRKLGDQKHLKLFVNPDAEARFVHVLGLYIERLRLLENEERRDLGDIDFFSELVTCASSLTNPTYMLHTYVELAFYIEKFRHDMAAIFAKKIMNQINAFDVAEGYRTTSIKSPCLSYESYIEDLNRAKYRVAETLIESLNGFDQSKMSDYYANSMKETVAFLHE